jgi:hypothetical protein
MSSGTGRVFQTLDYHDDDNELFSNSTGEMFYPSQNWHYFEQCLENIYGWLMVAPCQPFLLSSRYRDAENHVQRIRFCKRPPYARQCTDHCGFTWTEWR